MTPVIGRLCTDETPLSPLTVYGRTKTEAEDILKKEKNVIRYRFATAFGVSNRMRLDLLINDFVYQAVKIRNRAHEIAKAEGIPFAKAFKRAEAEVTEG